MVRIDRENLRDKDAVEETLKKHPKCGCGQPTTTWIYHVFDGKIWRNVQLFYCDRCALDLAAGRLEFLDDSMRIERKRER